MHPSLSAGRTLDCTWPELRISSETVQSGSTSTLDVSKLTCKAESRYVCNFENESPPLPLTLFPDKPSFACGPSGEVTEDDALQTVCEPEGLPRPVVAWVRDGKELESSHRCKKNDSGIYLLRATNEHGTAEHVLNLDVLCMFQHSLFSKYSSSIPLCAVENKFSYCVIHSVPFSGL